MTSHQSRRTPIDPSSDRDLVGRTAAHDQAAFEQLMRRHNGRLFRVARAILRQDEEAEDALQDAYLEAYRHMGDFRGDSNVATWLTRIVVNQALMRLRKRKREGVVVPFSGRESESELQMTDTRTESPSSATLRTELRRLMEQQVDRLPLAFRTVFVMREVEDMTVEETAAALSIPAATVRSRLFRARALLREALARDVDLATGELFVFLGDRCDRIVGRVLAKAREGATAG